LKCIHRFFKISTWDYAFLQPGLGTHETFHGPRVHSST
jgi:hypothetical protein